MTLLSNSSATVGSHSIPGVNPWATPNVAADSFTTNISPGHVPPVGSQTDALGSAVNVESGCNLLGLMQLARGAERDALEAEGSDTLNGIITKSVLRNLLQALHYRDVSSVRHTRRVAQLAVALAKHLGWDGRELKVLEVAALLHDVGKIGVPDNILFKPAKLSPDELELMALHSSIGWDVLQACKVHPDVLEIVSQSQTALAPVETSTTRVGRDVPQGARILAVADAYESLSTDQVYRPARPHDEIVRMLTESAGERFDANIVSALSRFVKTQGLPFAGPAKDLDESLRRKGPTSAQEAMEANSLCHVFSYLYVLESLYDGFYVVDADLRVICWNRGAEALLDRPYTDMLGKTWTRQLLGYATPEGEPLVDQQCPMHRVLQSSQAVAYELQLLRSDGRAIRAEVQAVPLLDDAGKLHGVVEIFRDLTRSGGRRPNEFRELKLAATRDALTGVANRGELESQLTALASEFAQRPDEPFSVIFADADHFKSVNDTYGHGVGDQVLIDLAKLMTNETYSGEVVGRYGGEEFVVLCPATDLDQAIRKAERLRTAIRASRIGGVERLQVTASFGVTQVESGDSVESVLRRADKALYMAKHAGRDRTCSLTNAQLLAGEANGDVPEQASDPFLYSTWFAAVVAADMVVYKLGGYVNDARANIVEVTSERVILRQGSAGLFGWWGSSEDKQPIEIEVHFGDALRAAETRARTRKTNINLRIRPLGWLKSPDAFQERAHKVTRELKNYFAAD